MKFFAWKEARPILIVMVSAFSIIGIFFTVLGMLYNSSMYCFTIACLLGIVLLFFIYGRLFSCIVLIEQEGIQRKCLKQSVLFKWSDIYEIKVIIFYVKHGGNIGQNVSILMIARRNITYDDKKHISRIVRKCDSKSIIAIKHTAEIENEIKKYYKKNIETEKFN